MFAMVIGVIVFSDFIGSLAYDSSISEPPGVVKYKTRIEFLRNKYSLSNKSVLQLEKIITKSYKVNLKDEVYVLNDLPQA